MGQGLYTAIVYGAIDPPCDTTDAAGYTDEAEWYAAAADDAERRRSVHFHSGGEATPFHRGVVVAVTDECLAEWWGVPSFDREVIDLEDPSAAIFEVVGRDHWDRCQAAWQDVRAAGAAVGVEVPEGRLLLVCDWD